MNNHIADAEKKPWYNQPTPLANQSAVEEYSPRLKMYVDLQTARNLERRMRAAEGMMFALSFFVPDDYAAKKYIISHLEAARKDDDQ